MRTFGLKLRMFLVIALMFAILFALFTGIAYLFGYFQPWVFVIMAVAIMAIQYFTGPYIVGWTMKVKYVTPQEEPRLHGIVNSLIWKRGIDKPKIGVSNMKIPNAFAFGRWKSDARVVVTRPLLEKLDDGELEAVLGHELSHVIHRDMMLMTAISVIPLICYYIFLSLVWGGMGGRGNRNAGYAVLIGLAAFVMYFVTNLLVLWVSRAREYYADAGSAEMTNQPYNLASGLYKLVLASKDIDEKALHEVEGVRAFFATDPTKAKGEVRMLIDADLNRDGKLDAYEVKQFAEQAKTTKFSRVAELFSTHPNPVKRIVKLAEMY
ncbi:MAG: zinc metalloprotease HtpX [Candidatus Jordarchaeum sp.]|uniref:zinc metalloprotease HtpX n=1 Tax=Candidatus Jordarchaeum sp. TaxID=2823881 RepID=UPI0040498D3F